MMSRQHHLVATCELPLSHNRNGENEDAETQADVATRRLMSLHQEQPVETGGRDAEVVTSRGDQVKASKP